MVSEQVHLCLMLRKCNGEFRRTKWKKHNPGVSPSVHQQQRQLAKQQQKPHRMRSQEDVCNEQTKMGDHVASMFDSISKTPLGFQSANSLFFFNNDYINSALLFASFGMDSALTAASSSDTRTDINPEKHQPETNCDPFCLD